VLSLSVGRRTEISATFRWIVTAWREGGGGGDGGDGESDLCLRQVGAEEEE
jgi:hypothetical protein